MKYSDTEDALIIQHYPELGAAGMHKAHILCNRSKFSIKQRARELRVRNKHYAHDPIVEEKRERWWDYPVTTGIAPRAVLA